MPYFHFNLRLHCININNKKSFISKRKLSQQPIKSYFLLLKRKSPVCFLHFMIDDDGDDDLTECSLVGSVIHDIKRRTTLVFFSLSLLLCHFILVCHSRPYVFCFCSKFQLEIALDFTTPHISKHVVCIC